jgi:hypothetical protein
MHLPSGLVAHLVSLRYRHFGVSPNQVRGLVIVLNTQNRQEPGEGSSNHTSYFSVMLKSKTCSTPNANGIAVAVYFQSPAPLEPASVYSQAMVLCRDPRTDGSARHIWCR